MVDIGATRDGIVLRKDLDLLDESYRDGLSVGDRVPVMILRTWGNRDGIVVSINKGLQNQDWLRASELLESEEIVEAEVVDTNRGGVLVQFGRLRGFVPNSAAAQFFCGISVEPLATGRPLVAAATPTP